MAIARLIVDLHRGVIHAEHNVRASLPVLRGLVLAAPIVVVLGVLLASADVVFARLFELDLDLPDVGDHFAVVALAWLAGCALAADAASPPVGRRDAVPRLLGPVEAATVPGSTVALFALFAGTQVVSWPAAPRTCSRPPG